ncbi:iron chelate uptake ABC transporter family permease subunit [Dactylosporangium sp. AC04546]|uniref:iron chelate uptake ABC transporter family permease subunit n=1 Tax=Dactylosporangium sp. AC04546 TaxID=2862460 RepID=UPI001EDD021F|nr:iron chelate uptake ABC transporter family permease subunit [Dactylosporangium sp. AC04546]WVK86872.1 iron chelate uptake ABC transporter family permease subunit [Dactylosporangium sp. AC04546]
MSTVLGRAAGLAGGLLVLVATVLASVAIGAKDLPLGAVRDALAGTAGGDVHYLVLQLRIPRTLAGIAAGASLGVAGALIQALTRNPLADPGILGVNAGATLFVTVGVAAFGVASVDGYVWFAFLGALLTTVAVYLVGAGGRGQVDPVRLTLGGVAIGAVLLGITTSVMLADPRAFDQMRSWEVGSLVNRDLGVLGSVGPFLVLGLLVAAAVARPLNAIALGDDSARALGAHVTRTRALVVVAVTLLAGGATALAGPIGFMGLIAPHVARWIVGPDQRWVLAYTVVLAPALLLGADVLGRIAMRPGEVPIGIISALVGAPVLIVLARRRRVVAL